MTEEEKKAAEEQAAAEKAKAEAAKAEEEKKAAEERAAAEKAKAEAAKQAAKANPKDAKAKELFKSYPAAKEFFFTSDAMAFLKPDDAAAHAKTLKDKTVTSVKR